MVLLQIIGAILILSFLIFIHELGHFLAAKKNGIKVHEFALGFPPTIWKKKKGETTYKLNLIPFGGYVKLHGEDSFDPKILKDKKSFASKSPWQKIQVLLAGVVMNFFVFWILSSLALAIGTQPMILSSEDLYDVFRDGRVEYDLGFMGEDVESSWDDYENGNFTELVSKVESGGLKNFIELPAWRVGEVESDYWGQYLQEGDLLLRAGGDPVFSRDDFVESLISNEVVSLDIYRDGEFLVDELIYDYNYEITQVLEGSVAEESGVLVGDVLLEVGGEDVHRGNSVVDINKKNIGVELDYLFLRNGEEVVVSMTPNNNGLVGMAFTPRFENDLIGFGYTEVSFPYTINDFVEEVAFWKAPFIALSNAWEISKLTASGFVGTILDVFFSFNVSEEIGGPVQVFKLSYEFVGIGGTELMNFIALISLSLAVINILPIPALDGGRILFVIIEALRGAPMDRKIEAYIHAIGFALLMTLILVVTVFDFLRL